MKKDKLYFKDMLSAMKKVNIYRLSVIIFIITLCVAGTSKQVKASYQYPANNKVLLFAPGYSKFDPPQDEIYDSALDLFNDAKFFKGEVKPGMTNENASVEIVKSFSDYGTVIIHAHGRIWESKDNPGIIQTGFRTGVIAGYEGQDISEMGIEYRIDLDEDRLTLSKTPNMDDEYNYVVLPGFIDEYVSEMPDTFLYLGYCNSLQNDKMWEAFKNKGAKVAFGYTDKIMNWDLDGSFYESFGYEDKGLMYWMLPGMDSGLPSPLTAGHAFAMVYPKHWDYPDDGYYPDFVMRNEPGWENFIFAQEMIFAVITGSDYALIWDIRAKTPAVVPLNSGGIAPQPVLKADISDWLAARQLVPSQNLYSYQHPIVEGSKTSDFVPAECFDQLDNEYYMSCDSGLKGESGTFYDSCSSTSGGGAASMANTQSWNKLENPFDRSSYICNSTHWVERNFPYWRAGGKAPTSYEWYRYTSLLDDRSLQTGVKFSGSGPMYYGTMKVVSNNTGNDGDYLIHTSWQNTQETNIQSTYAYCGEGPAPFEHRTTRDTITVSDPWGFYFTMPFYSYFFGDVINNEQQRQVTARVELQSHELKMSYALSGKFTDRFIVQVRAVKPEVTRLNCTLEGLSLYQGSFTACASTATIPFRLRNHIYATIDEFDDTASVSPFTLPANNELTLALNYMIGVDWPNNVQIMK